MEPDANRIRFSGVTTSQNLSNVLCRTIPMSDNIKVISGSLDSNSIQRGDGMYEDGNLEEKLNTLHDEGYDVVAGGCAQPGNVDRRIGPQCTFILQKNVEKLSR